MVALPDVEYSKGLPKLIRSVSQSRAGNRLVSSVEYADPFWQIEMETGPLDPALAPTVRAFLEEANGGTKTVLWAPSYLKVPQAYWANPGALAPSIDGLLASVTNGFNVAISSTAAGLDIRRGDMISMTYGAYRSLHRVMVGAVGGAGINLTLEPFVPPYITPGATVKFKGLSLNTRMVVGSDSMTDDYNPVATFTLVEVPQ